MASDDVGQCPYREAIVARDAAAQPCSRRYVPEQRDGRSPHGLEFFYVSRPRHSVCLRSSSCGVLVVAGQRALKPASEPQSPKRRRPLGISDVIEHLANAPLFRSIPVERLFLRDHWEEFQRVFQLPLKDTEDIITVY